MRALLLTAFLLPLTLAGNTYFVTDNFASGVSGAWQTNGTIAGNGTVGLYSSAANGGSAIYGTAVVDTLVNLTDVTYEVKATLQIQASGGVYVLYSHATTNALTGPGGSGSYYAAEFTPTLTSGGCTMAANYYKSVGGTVYQMGSQTMACKDGMTVRWTQRQGYFSIYTSLQELVIIGDGSVASGRPGFGARAMPAGNGIRVGELGKLEYAAPGSIVPTSLRTALFDTRVDLAWTGVVDDVNGSGLLMYHVHRNGSFLGNVRGAYFSDATVAPSTTYTYTIYPHDVHLNLSSYTFQVTTPGSDQKDARKVGVRPLGTYWGASPENIDLQSGNLSFSLPTVTAQGRGGTAAPMRLSYNSLNWRKQGASTWLLGSDVGFGFGWKMLAGALTPVYSDWYTVHHFTYTDSTGAEHDLDVNTGGVWRAKTGIFVEYDAAAKRLYFPGGSFWEFDCTANGTEADAGTMYPTRLVDTNGNEIKLRYQGGLHYGGVNGSARVSEVEDVRAALVSGAYKSYSFTYNNDAIPHLTLITSHVGDGASYALSYSSGHPLKDPFAAADFGTA